MKNKITLVNLYKDIVLSDPSLHFLYNFVFQKHIKIVVQIHAIQIYPYLHQKKIFLCVRYDIFYSLVLMTKFVLNNKRCSSGIVILL